MTNKELQKLFQSKLGSRKVDFNPSSWEGMERILDSKMPVVPWYLPFASWVKGLTAAKEVGFSGYFIIGEPFEGYTKEGSPSESISVYTTTNATSKPERSRFQLTNGSAATANSRFSIQRKDSRSSDLNNELEAGFNNVAGSNSFAFADRNENGPGRKLRRKNKKQTRQGQNNPLIQERLIISL